MLRIMKMNRRFIYSYNVLNCEHRMETLKVQNRVHIAFMLVDLFVGQKLLDCLYV